MMTFTASAPGRCGILGNPSDIYGGHVVSASLPVRARCRIILGEEGPLPQDTRLLDAALKRVPLPQPFRVEWSTNVPRSSGVSGSTALLAATLLCLVKASGAEEPADWAEFVRDVERHDAQIMCGYQDAVMIVRGGVQSMDFAGKHPVNPGPLPSVAPLDAPLPFLLITTGVERLSGGVHGPMSERWLAGEANVVRGMTRIAELGRQGASLLQSEDWHGLADAMTENHAIIRDLGGSGDPIDSLIAECLDEGALAAKLAGAGMGGTVIALTLQPEELQDRLARRGRTRFIRPSASPGLRLEDSAE